MGKRVLAIGSLFVVVTVLSAPWLISDDQGVPHYNAARKGTLIGELTLLQISRDVGDDRGRAMAQC